MSSSQMTQQLEPECAIAGLPVELIDRIFSSLSDVRTLYDTQFVCKWWRDIFNAHPANLRKAVAANILGSHLLLLAALRGVRVDAQFKDDKEFDDVPATLAVAGSNLLETEITWQETRALQLRASVCARLEVCFSRSRKDRLSGQKSRLTPSESIRFRLSILHAWLISDVFEYFGDRDPEQLDGEDTSSSNRSGLYLHLSNEELHDLDTVIRWAVEAAGGQSLILLDLGPAAYVDVYESVDRDGMYGQMDMEELFNWDDELSLLWSNRKVQLEKNVPKGVTPLCPAGASSDTCSNCADPAGFNLWNEQNWPYLATNLQLWVHWQNLFFVDGLTNNDFEVKLFRAYIENPFADYSVGFSFAPVTKTSPYGKQGDPDLPGGPISVARILKELFALPGEINNDSMKTYMSNAGFDTTQPQDWLCVNCLHKFVRSRLWIWWYNEKARGKVSGQGFKTDCWYGKECRTQTHTTSHAEKRNHLCFNTSAAKLAARNASANANASAGPSSSTAPNGTNLVSVTPSAGSASTVSVPLATATNDSSGSTVTDTNPPTSDQGDAVAQAAVADAELI